MAVGLVDSVQVYALQSPPLLAFAVASRACSVASPLYSAFRDLVDRCSVSHASDLFVFNIRDSKLYISFSVAALGLALLRHCVLLSQRRDGCDTTALAWVRRSLLKHVTVSVRVMRGFA
jgi:hypothetical protein